MEAWQEDLLEKAVKDKRQGKAIVISYPPVEDDTLYQIVHNRK